MGVQTLLHEEFHLNQKEKIVDHWYLDFGLDEMEKKAVGPAAEAHRFAVMEAKSKSMMEGSMVVAGDFWHISSMVGAGKLDEFKVDPRLRTTMALTNADSLSYVVGAISRAVQSRKNQMG